MRLALLISAPIVVPAIVAAQQLTPDAEILLRPPGYKMLRFDEDYSYLTNQASRTDLVDPIKYIPLRRDDPLWYLTIGGELRERYEGHYDPNFGIGSKGSDSYLLQRITLLTDVHLGERLRFFAEGISGVIVGESHPAPPVQDNPIDLQFAFADVVPWLKDDERLTLRAGRFGMSFGAGRLVAIELHGQAQAAELLTQTPDKQAFARATSVRLGVELMAPLVGIEQWTGLLRRNP